MKRLVTGLIYGFLLVSPLFVLYYSFSPSVTLGAPAAPTLQWYENLLRQPRLLTGMTVSTGIALLATAVSLLSGVPAAYALTRFRFTGRDALASFFLAPLVLPGVVLALGILMTLSAAAPGLAGTIWPLLAAHLLITLPWVIRTVSAGLSVLDPHLEEAARGLGAGPVETFFLVTLPGIRSAVIAASLFAFIVSFGNFALSMFFTSGRVTTLPVAIFEYIDQFQDPTVAAASSVVILGTTALVVLASVIEKPRSP